MLDHGNEPVGWKDKAPRPSHRRGRLIVERTIHGNPHGNAANTIRRLRLVQVDHHFVPTRDGSDNDLQIVYSIKGFSGEPVKLRVSCDNHDPKLIFERELTDEEKKDGRKKLIKWNGVPNCASGPVKDVLPHPILGDLKVTLWSAEIQSKEEITRVLYREIKFEPVTWSELYMAITGLTSDKFADAKTPDHQKKWIQYKLNELGYIGGPLGDMPGANSTMRALFRYTQSHPNLAKFNDFQTRDIAPGACNWGWKQLWDAKFGTLDDLCSGGTTTEGADLMKCLQDGEEPRADLVENANVFLDPKEKSRIIIDHDIFYINKDFARANANAGYDREFLNRFCWPLMARVFLVAREDLDATKPGVDSPEAVGPVDMDWIAYDPPEDISCVPPATSAPVPQRLKSRAREFIGETHKKLAGQYGDEHNALDNCPSSAGGERPSDAGDMSVYFEGTVAAPDDRTLIGCNVTQFKGSYIGGDNYVIHARLALRDHPNSEAVKQEHLKLKGLEKAFDDPEPNEPPHPLHAQTGTITNWRRHHILRELRWDSISYPEVNWFPIIDNFRAAHIILVPPAEAPIHVENLLPAADLLNIVRAAAADPDVPPGANKNEFQLRAAHAAFNRGGIYPVPLFPLRDWETSTLNVEPIATTPGARFNQYTKYLRGTEGWPSYDIFVPIARMLRASISALNKGWGLVILRGNYIPDPDYPNLLPADVYNAVSSELGSLKFSKSIAVGLDYGIVLLDRVGTEKFAEPYFLTHEISHCLFGSHAFQADSKEEHDLNDKNCIMYYNTYNSGLPFGWGVKSRPDKYQMRLLIEYDPAEKADCGTLTGGWIQKNRATIPEPSTKTGEIEARLFEFSGTLEEIRRAFAETVVTPARWLATNKTFRVRLDTPVACPQLSVSYPYDTRIKATGGKVRPFENITVDHMDLKAAEPRFCGKCLLKLRGWRVGKAGATYATDTLPAVVPEKSPATPVNGRMVFEGYQVAEGKVTFDVKGAPKVVQFGMDARDPDNRKVLIGPFQFLHKHTFYWESSTGNLNDLTMPTREVVKYQRPTQVAPFNQYADPDQQFAQSGGTGKDGNGSDMHSMRLPTLICERNWGIPTGGSSLIATQSYQYCTTPRYSLDDADWVDIPNSQFRLEKAVYQMGKDWIMMFKKSNLPENPVPFNFEVHYRIGPVLSFEPDLKANRFAGATQANPSKTYISEPRFGIINQLVWAAGDQTIAMKQETVDRPVTIEQLIKAGFAIRGSQPMK